MDRNDVIFATAILLFGSYCIGFLSHWIINRLSHVSKSDLGELDKMADTLHRSEEARDKLALHQETVEARLRGRISQTEAELKAAMEGLRDARSDAEELRAFISSQNMGN